MQKYRYKAVTETGKSSVGTMEAANEADLELRLQRMQLDLISCREVTNPSQRFGSRKVSRKDIISFTMHLEQLVHAGIPLLDALKDIRDTIDHVVFKNVISQVVESIEGGVTFSAALKQHPQVFTDVYAAMVRVGELSGMLGNTLRDLAESLQWQEDIRARASRVMIYPAFVTLVMFAVVPLLMATLVPQLVKFLNSVGHELPWHTQLLIDTSDFFVDYWPYVVASPFVVIGLIYTARKRSFRVRYVVDGLMLRFWLLGPLFKRMKLARFANHASILYGSGITVLEAIDVAKDTVHNSMIEQALVQVQQRISEGEGIAKSFAAEAVFPPMITRIVRVGETSGMLDKSFMQISSFYTRETRDSIDRLEQFIGPILILFVGSFFLWIIVSVIAPLYSALFTGLAEQL